MSETSQPDPLSMATAEEVLRVLYGDDLKGCNVTIESIASLVQVALRQQTLRSDESLDIYEKLVEALHLLSTPPQGVNLSDRDKLNELLIERLDKIHTLTTKAIETAPALKGQRRI